MSDPQPSIPAGAHIGHVHLKVADLDRAVDFYRRGLGFELITRFGNQAAFLSAGGYHHHIGLNTWESQGGAPPPPGSTGLYHFAINYPERRDLAAALKRLLDNGWGIDGASDHGTHEAIRMAMGLSWHGTVTRPCGAAEERSSSSARRSTGPV